MDDDTIEPAPYRASSVHYAIAKAPESAQLRLRGLYALHRKWYELATMRDDHTAVTGLNWWHHELESCQHNSTAIPALRALQAEIWRPECAQTLQLLLHGHMHYHHLTRVDTLDQLQPTIDAMGGQFAKIWLLMCGASVPETLPLAAGRALWWVDNIRHIGHNLSNEHLWIPTDWLRETDTPAHLVLKTDLPANERYAALKALMHKLIQQAQTELTHYDQQYDVLTTEQRHDVRSWHALMTLRDRLLHTIRQEPAEVFSGMVTLAPLRKWWCAVRS